MFVMEDERIVDDLQHDGEEHVEGSLRPEYLHEYIGQQKIKNNLKVFIDAAKLREESLDHVLLYGPPGLGKTTLANIIANELNVNMRNITGPSIERPGDLAAILSSLQPGDVLFIDEIHRLPRVVEEVLYSAMEDFILDIVVGQGEEARSLRIDIPPFTLIGATTRVGSLSSPLRDRFGVHLRLEYYDEQSLQTIILRTSEIFNIEISEQPLEALAKRSRGTPRIANRLLRRVRDFAQVENDNLIDLTITNKALTLLNIDQYGLDHIDHKIMNCIIEQYNGGPVGLNTIAVSIGEETITLEDVYEPYLIQKGFIERTTRGRRATQFAHQYFNSLNNELRK